MLALGLQALAFWPGDDQSGRYPFYANVAKRPALCFVATDKEGRTVGVAQCWTSAFIKDLAVQPDRRGQGLGSALILEALQAFRQRGATHVDLKVDPENPSGALRLYRSHGFEEIESTAWVGPGLIPKACSMAGLPSRSRGRWRGRGQGGNRPPAASRRQTSSIAPCHGRAAGPCSGRAVCRPGSTRVSVCTSPPLRPMARI